MSCLSVEQLAFSYGKRQIFQDVSFRAEPGQIFCLAGPNGCGKTTLEHCILGHLNPQKGTVLIDGQPTSSLSPSALAERIAYVPQSHTRSFPYETVDVVAMGRTRMRSPFDADREHRQKALEVMDKLGIAHLARTEYTTLSGGELQMVLLARALCQQSGLLVLDEPTAHLDVQRSWKILLLLAQLAREEGKTILLSTHDFNHPLLLRDEGADVRVALMEGGRLSGSGDPMQLLVSSQLERIYGISGRILTVSGEKPRHYLATWMKEDS